jgi:hypothetical protein
MDDVQLMQPKDTRSELLVKPLYVLFIFKVSYEWLAFFQVKLGCVVVTNYSKWQICLEFWTNFIG